ncbi:hypothetical protein HOLleu_39778 [Holothuria leucospilota]|uniref:Reverse transcriptase n=1 Tax=Holothuria leucospilota TaxID=206669 RepID=A0A9Q1BB69_HOLLE|nr:hypothetical protein HOLleu_39778 [Holothuria leucospilota]
MYIKSFASIVLWYVNVTILFHVTVISSKLVLSVQTEYSRPMEIEKLVKVGKELGFSGEELKAFIDVERIRLKEERDEARRIRAEEREEEHRLLIEAQEYKLKSKELEVKEIELKLVQKEQEIKEKEFKVKDGNVEGESSASEGEGDTKQGTDKKGNIYTKAPKLPKFEDGKDNMDAYLTRFERYADSRKWKKKSWALNLSTLLTGKGLTVYYSLSAEEADNYEVLKSALLKSYELTEEGFRNKFNSSRPESKETASQFATRLTNYLQRWIDLSGTSKSFEGIMDLLIRDQFIHSCPKELSLYIRERQPKDVQSLVKLAEQYIDAHGGWFTRYNRNNRNREQSQSGDNPRQSQSSNLRGTESTVGRSATNLPSGRSNITCYVCGKRGHRARECRSRNTLAALIDGAQTSTSLGYNQAPPERIDQTIQVEYDNRDGPYYPLMSNQGQINSSTRPDQANGYNSIVYGQRQSPQAMTGSSDTVAFLKIEENDSHLLKASKKGFLALECGHKIPMLTAACQRSSHPNMPVEQGFVGKKVVQVLRDTGCSGAVVNKKFVEDSQYTGEEKMCVLIDGTVRRFPVAVIDVSTPYFTGKVSALCMNDPVFDLILGNIQGIKNLINVDFKGQSGEIIEKECISETTATVQTRNQRGQSAKAIKPLKVVLSDDRKVTPESVANFQQNDFTLKKIRELAKSGTKTPSKKAGYQTFNYENGIIFREYQSPNVNHGEPYRQLVVPLIYRKNVLKLAHESLFGGHQGIKKTKFKILTEFYWPGVGADVRRYCQSCDICQRTIPKGRITKVPLGDMPLMNSPFERVAVDLVGPLKPSTDRGHRYILVLMDYATRYPEAEALKTIETEVVAESLVNMFSYLGIPQEMLTDQGSQFVSGLMKEVCRLLSIRKLNTTPYHAMCNGLVERYNGTLKQMLKKMCEEKPRDWDRYLKPLLFAYRETPNENTGFSPFELLFGRQVRGPMQLLKELWTGQCKETETKTTYQYVLELQNRLEETCKLAQENLKKAKQKQARYYNRKAKDRTFKVGDEVLLLIPNEENKLLMQWKGPFPIVEKLNSMNYKIDFGHRAKVFHANMLKRYYRRSEGKPPNSKAESVLQISAVAIIEPEENESEMETYGNELLHLPRMQAKESVKDVNVNPGLDWDKQKEVRRLLGNFKEILTDIPGRTNLGKHEIRLTDSRPIKCAPYALPHAIKSEVEKDIENMLKMGIISQANSPYAFPLVALRKTDGTLRNCVDMRKLNQVTIFDAEPIPNQEEIFSQLSKDIYFTKIDLSKGYWQIPMEETSKQYTTFVTNSGLYQFNVMPFGLVNSGATFSRIMRILLKDLQNVHNYIDDILIHTSTWEEHLKTVKEVLKRLRSSNLTARPTKCFIGYEEIEFLGHVVGKGTIKPKEDKVQAVKQAKRPETKTQLRSFLGLVGFYRKFIPDFSTIALPLTNLTKKGEPNKLKWDDRHENAFRTLRRKVASYPILNLPDVSKEFVLRSDASTTAMGAVLLQETAGELFPVAYASKKFNKAQCAYSVTEKECLAIIWAVQKFQTYLYGKEFVIQTDHQPLSCIKRAKVANGRLLRWALMLQPYRYRIEIIKGSENIGADYLSRSEF